MTDNDSGAPSTRIEVQRAIAADPAAIFAMLRDPKGHVAIDASGMLMDATWRARIGGGRHLHDPHGP